MSLTRSLCLLFRAIHFFFFFIALSYALPIDRETPLSPSTYDGICDSIDTYTTDWFLANTRPEYRKELHGKALFYTRGTSRSARDLAEHSHGRYVSIWEVWPCWLHNDEQAAGNRLSCIHHDRMQRTTFYENMSRAFARMSRKSATVMHMSADYEEPPLDGIWARIELPALRKMTDVEMLNKINEHGGVPTSYYIARGTWQSVQLAVERAMEDVRAIFRNAKVKTIDGAGTYSIWHSVDDAYLDSLW